MKPIAPLACSALLSFALTACQAPAQIASRPPAALQTQTEAGISHAGRKLLKNLISIFDRNGDGRLDKSEVKIPLLLRLLDKNGDGFLTQDELNHPLAEKAIMTFLRETTARTFGLADRNDDKIVDYREFVVTSDMDNKLMKILFHMVDNNFDDRLSQAEYEDFIAQSIAVGSEGFDWLTRTPGFSDAIR